MSTDAFLCSQPDFRSTLPARSSADLSHALPIAAFLKPPAIPSVPARAGRLRALFRNFFSREVRTRYLGSFTGLAWALVHPLALLGVYWFVFTTVFRTRHFGGQSFLAFVAVALWPWLAAQEALSRATVSLAGYAGLIRKVAFPHEIVVYASVAATLTLQSRRLRRRAWRCRASSASPCISKASSSRFRCGSS